jgi:hypothetical protein
MHFLHFNLPGIVICALAFGAAFGAGYLAGTFEEGPLMMIAGPLCVALDVSYRRSRLECRWFHPEAGGNLLLIPIWLLGIVWLVLGAFYTIRGHS